MFTRKLKRPAANPVAGPPPRDPLLAIPRPAPCVEWRQEPSDLVQLRRELPPRSRLDGVFRRWLRTPRQIRVNLDAHGSFFWRQVDGRRNLASIAAALATQFGLPAEDARVATVRFTRDLMVRSLLQLEIPTP